MTLGVVLTGCPNAEKDYDDFVSTARSKASPAPPSFLPPATKDTVDINGTYVAFCKVNFATADQALRLKAEIKVDEGGTMEMMLTPLVINAKNLSEMVGAGVPASASFLNNQFKLDFGTITIAGEANPISGSAIELGDTALTGVAVSGDKLVAELDGQLIKPFATDLTAPGDVCLFLRTDGPIPDPAPSEADFKVTSAGASGAGGSGGLSLPHPP